MNFREYIKEDSEIKTTISESFISDTVKKYANKIGIPAYIFMLTWQFEKEKTTVLKSIKDYSKGIEKDSDEYKLVMNTFDTIESSLSDAKLKSTLKILKDTFIKGK